MTILISALLTFLVAGIINSGFTIYFFAGEPSEPAALRLKYVLKSVFAAFFPEKNNDDKKAYCN